MAEALELTYGPDPKHKLDLYTSTDLVADNSAPSLPLIIYVHGGAWRRCALQAPHDVV